MPVVKILDNTRSIIDNVSLQGTKVTIGNLLIDCETEQIDSERVIDIFYNQDGSFSVGSGDMFVASISIPAKKYSEVDTGEVDEDGNPVKQLEEVPLLSSEIIITLWPIN